MSILSDGCLEQKQSWSWKSFLPQRPSLDDFNMPGSLTQELRCDNTSGLASNEWLVSSLRQLTIQLGWLPGICEMPSSLFCLS